MKVIQVVHQADYVHRINTQLPFNIFVDISSFLSYAAAFRSQAIKNETVFNAYMAKQNMIEFCSSLKFKLGDQNDIYNHADTSSTKRAFNKVLSKLEIAYNLGENRITRKIDLFSRLIDKMAMMSLLNCMLAVVFVSLTMLSAFVISSIFSSMMLDRYREICMLRMIGMRKSHIVYAYLIQSAILGLISTLISIPLLHYSFIVINDFMVAGIAESYTLTFSKESIFVGLTISISIPLISTLNSLQTIIKMRVLQGLDNNKPISSMQIQDGPKHKMIGRVIACLIVVVYGLGIYVLIPLTLIKGEIFFTCILLILIGGSLCLGIAFLLMNMWKWANRLTETIVLIFDRPYIMDLVSNVKGIHYSTLLKLAWTIMIGICIVTNLNSLLYCLLSENVLTELRLVGGPISGLGNFTGAELREWSRKNFLKPGEFEQAYILNSKTNVYIPKDQANRALPPIYTSMTTENIGRIKSLKSRIRGVTPNYPDLAATRFIDVEWPTHTSTSLTPFEYLYTRFGYGEVIIPDQMRNKLALDCGTFNNQRVFLYQYHMLNKQTKPYFVKLHCSRQKYARFRI